MYRGIFLRMGIAALVALSAPIAFAAWGNGSGNGPLPPPTVAVACGDLSGNVGACWLTGGSFSRTGTGSNSMVTTDKVGVQWVLGAEPNTASQLPAPQWKVNSEEHVYHGTGTFTLTISISTTNAIGGTAGPAAASPPAPPFKWDWTGETRQNDPKYAWFDPVTGFYSTTQSIPSSWEAPANTRGIGVANGSGGTVTLGATSTNGSYGASGSLTPPSGVTQMAVWTTFTSTAKSASAKNARILLENFLKMNFTFTTSV